MEGLARLKLSLMEAVNCIERNQQFQQLAKNEKFYNSALDYTFGIYCQLGRVNVELGEYDNAEVQLKKALMIHAKYESDFNKNPELMYQKILLFYYTGRCYTFQDKLERGLEFLQQSLDLTKEHQPHNLGHLVHCLYDISWNQLIGGELHDALVTINESVNILDRNEANSDKIRSHQKYIIRCRDSTTKESRIFSHNRHKDVLLDRCRACNLRPDYYVLI